MPVDTVGGENHNPLDGYKYDLTTLEGFQRLIQDTEYLAEITEDIQVSRAVTENPEYGDVNADGVVDIMDALMVAQYSVGLTVEIEINVADVNIDGVIDILDALLIAQYYVGLINVLPFSSEDNFDLPITWQNMSGSDNVDEGRGLFVTAGGGVMVAGVASSQIGGIPFGGNADCYVVELDSNGDVLWQDMYGGSAFDRAEDITETSDGGFILAGLSRSTNITGVTNNGGADFYVVKVDENGNAEWQDMYGGDYTDLAWSIQQTSDGGYIVAGESYSEEIAGHNGECDAYIVKLDSSGTIEWQKMYGGSGTEVAESIIETSDGGYIVVGFSNSNTIPGTTWNGGMDIYIIKLDVNGDISWQGLYGGGGSDMAYACQETADGYIIAGWSNSMSITGVENNGDFDVYVLKIDLNGVLEWHDMYGGSNADAALGIAQTDGGDFIVSGLSDSTDIFHVNSNGSGDIYLIKLDSDGSIIWQELTGGNGRDNAFAVAMANDGECLVAGLSDSTDIPGVNNYGFEDCYVIKFDPND